MMSLCSECRTKERDRGNFSCGYCHYLQPPTLCGQLACVITHFRRYHHGAWVVAERELQRTQEDKHGYSL